MPLMTSQRKELEVGLAAVGGARFWVLAQGQNRAPHLSALTCLALLGHRQTEARPPHASSPFEVLQYFRELAHCYYYCSSHFTFTELSPILEVSRSIRPQGVFDWLPHPPIIIW